MGAKGSKAGKCLDLTEASNACLLAQCLGTITGLPSDSASPSDNLFVGLRPGARYEGKEVTPNTRAFLKLWINRKSFWREMREKEQGETDENIALGKALVRLDDEAWIYRECIRPVVDSRVTPGLVRFLASGKECSSQDVLEILRVHPSLKKPKPKALKALARSVSYLLQGKPGRPSTTSFSSLEEEDYDTEVLGRLKFEILMTEAHPPPETLSLEALGTSPEFKEEREREVRMILLQLVAVCDILDWLRVMHGDLGPGNVLVTVTDKEPVTRALVHEGVWHVFRSHFLARIFDFDRAVAVRRHRNEEFLPRFNLANLVQKLWYFPEFVSRETLLWMIRSGPEADAVLVEWFDGFAFGVLAKRELIPNNIGEKFASTLEIMDRLLGQDAARGPSNDDEIFVADSSCFDPETGEFDPAKAALVRAQVLASYKKTKKTKKTKKKLRLFTDVS